MGEIWRRWMTTRREGGDSDDGITGRASARKASSWVLAWAAGFRGLGLASDDEEAAKTSNGAARLACEKHWNPFTVVGSVMMYCYLAGRQQQKCLRVTEARLLSGMKDEGWSEGYFGLFFVPRRDGCGCGYTFLPRLGIIIFDVLMRGEWKDASPEM